MSRRRHVYYQGGTVFTEGYSGKVPLSEEHSFDKGLGLRKGQLVDFRQGWECDDGEWKKLLQHIGRRMKSFTLDKETLYRIQQIPKEWEEEG